MKAVRAEGLGDFFFRRARMTSAIDEFAGANVTYEKTIIATREDPDGQLSSSLEEGVILEKPYDRKVFKLIWFVCGASQLLYWNSILNAINDVVTEYYPAYPRLSDTLTIAMTLADFIVAAITVKRGYSNVPLNLYSGFAFACIPLTTALVIHTCPPLAGVVLLHVIGVVAGILLALVQAGHFGLSGYMPVNATPWVAAGLGVGGTTTFLLYMLFSEGIFRNSTIGAVWASQIFNTCVLLAAFAGILWMTRIPEIQESFKKARDHVLRQRKDPQRPKFRRVALAHWAHLAVALINAFHTYWIYPNIGPFRWYQSSNLRRNLLIGVNQVVGAMGALLPALSRFCPFGFLTDKQLYWMTFLKFFLIVPALLMWLIDENSFLDNYATQLIVFIVLAVTDGWISTMAIIAGPMKCEDAAARGSLSSLNVLATLGGIALGQVTAKAVAFGVEGTF